MKKSKKKKKNTRILNNYLGMALISVVVVLLLGVLTVQSNELKAKISSYDTRSSRDKNFVRRRTGSNQTDRRRERIYADR